MRQSFVSAGFLERFQQPVLGDTPLMREIRRGDSDRIRSILAAEMPELSSTNSIGETALYLALRVGELDLVHDLWKRGALDAGDIVADPYSAKLPINTVSELAGDVETALDSFLVAKPDMRTLKFYDLK